jgi:hypothetical protein
VTVLGVRSIVRSAQTGLLDTFLVAAVGTVLVIRLFLEATGYPRLGGGELHIAHVLWGGLGMLIAFVLLLGFLSSATRHIAALVGGAGFGAFIDELGKFVTSDNNYFYRPTAAVVYVLFVVLFLVGRQVWRLRQLSPRESLVNAIDLAEDLVAGDLDEYERSRALELLSQSDQDDPLVPILRQRFRDARVSGASPYGLRQLRGRASGLYRRVVTTTAFRRVLLALFTIEGVVIVLSLIAVIALITATLLGVDVGDATLDIGSGGPFAVAVQFIATVVAGALIIRGLVAVRRHSRLTAYRSFELAILVDLLLNQPFAFLDQGFGQSFDVLFDLALLAVLRYLKAEEHRLLAVAAEPTALRIGS